MINTYKYLGQSIEIWIPRKYGFDGYSVECQYRYDKQKDKYLVSAWLKRRDMADRLKIESQEIDTQYITSTRETITSDVCKIVETMCEQHYIDHFVEEFEYTCRCFDIGNSILEKQKDSEGECPNICT